MANRRVEDYAYRYHLSNRKAKKALGKSARGEGAFTLKLPERGAPIAGTGKPAGASKKG